MTPKVFIGIDPGLDGALCRYDPAGRVPTRFEDMPTVTVSGSKRKHREIVESELCDALRRLGEGFGRGDLVLVSEKLHAMPTHGVIAAFRLGDAYGLIRGVAAAFGLELHQATPQAWKKAMLAGEGGPKRKSAGKADKSVSIVVAKRLDPSLPLVRPGCRVPSPDRAEAYLIARYGAGRIRS